MALRPAHETPIALISALPAWGGERKKLGPGEFKGDKSKSTDTLLKETDSAYEFLIVYDGLLERGAMRHRFLKP